jgi:outer membrane immunogenic protein
MKKFLTTVVGLVALGAAGPAMAADMAVKAPPPAPMMAPIYNWTGFYIGGNGGWGKSHSCVDFLDGAGVAFAQGCRDRSGGVVGGQIGYRWQANQWVLGLEAQGDWADLSNTRVSVLNPALSTRTKTSGIGLFTGQIGYAWNNTLLYMKGGAALTSDRYRGYLTANGAQISDTVSDTRWGGVIGLGLEYGFAPNWSAAVEYDHMFMQDRFITFTNNGTLAPASTAYASDRIHQDVDLVAVRVN